MSATRHVLRSAEVISEPHEAVMDGSPCPSTVVSLKVPNVLQDDKWGVLALKNLDDLME
jgi:hypothetical protein